MDYVYSSLETSKDGKRRMRISLDAIWKISEMLGCLALVATGIFGYRKYRQTKQKERLQKDFEMRRDFILHPKLSRMQGIIEHQGSELETLLKKLVDAENPHTPTLLTHDEQELHEKLDQYVNYLEAVGSLRRRKWIREADCAGFWDYYFHRIGDWPLLYQYVSAPRYGWDDVTRRASQLAPTGRTTSTAGRGASAVRSGVRRQSRVAGRRPLTLCADYDHDGEVDRVLSSAPTAYAVAYPLIGDASAKSHGRLLLDRVDAIPGAAGRVVVRLTHSKPGSHLVVQVDRPARNKVQLLLRSDSDWTSLGVRGTWTLDASKQNTFQLLAAPIELPHGPSSENPAWSGRFGITISLLGANGACTAVDTVRFRTAPFMLASALDRVEEVVMVENDRTANAVMEIEESVIAAEATLTKLCVDPADPADVWIQDAVKIGGITTPAGQRMAILTGLRKHYREMRCGLLDDRAEQVFRERGAEIIKAGVPRAETQWIDWYGNLQVSPPVTTQDGTRFPFGRILVGQQHELGMHPDVLAFLEAQWVQVPPLVVDTSWLLIGHVDEVVNFVPAPDRKGFRVLIPSPSLARRILESCARDGHATAIVFAGHKDEATVQELLDKHGRSEENREISRRLKEIRTGLSVGLGLANDDFIDLPVLFHKGRAVIPNSVNSLICNDHAIVPDPLGPKLAAGDPIAQAIRQPLEALGMHVVFVDVWKPFHEHAGEIHCGTVAIRRLCNGAWWEWNGPRS